MRRRILVPLDGSSGSEAILPRVAELARGEHATVRLLFVAPPAQARVAPDGRILVYADQEAARLAENARAYLMRAAAALAGIDVQLAVRFGDPAAEILDEADSGGVDLIAMATHQRTGLRRLLEGSVAEHVERLAHVPVLLVGRGAPVPA
ncbi:MAG: universal stress protein [Candidatus Rokubacteria bacterium]|nr:universal stress protein [Candidatus Rokubacteria bacterium]